MNQAGRSMKGEAGFSLIELMIVVAIMGILATIAVPNFNRFQAKAKQSEAKTNLAALFAAEKAFYAEWSTYYADFRDLGFMPTGRLGYHMGFAGGVAQPGGSFSPSTTGGAGAGTCINTPQGNCGFTFTLMPNLPSFAAVTAAGCGQAGVATTPTATAFTATAVGKPSESGVTDVWSINEGNILCNNTNGI